MSVNKPRFPEEEWEGGSPVRDGGGAKDARPDYEDWDQVVAELRKTQLQLIVRAAAGEDLVKTNVVKINTSGQLVKAQANLVDNAGSMGVIVKSVLSGNMATAQTVGTVEGFTGLSRGQLYYLDDATAGGLRTTPGTVNRLIGIGKSSTELLLLLGMGTGAQGPPGEQGVQGPPGEDGEDGLGFTLVGEWNDMADYEINDVVSHNGSGYACVLAHSDQEPPNATYWQVIGAKGETGEQGPQGDPGEQGAPGANGTSFIWAGNWSNVVTYNENDVVLHTDDSLYIATQTSLNSPPDSTPADWDLFLPAGQQGETGAAGAGYGGTSTTSVTISLVGNKTLTTQAGLAYLPGARIRISSIGSPGNWLEGIVVDYTGTTLEFEPDLGSGSGSYDDWTINIAGERGTAGQDAPEYGGTSTTSNTFGVGTKTFTTQAGLAWVAGSRIRVISDASLDFMEGVVTSYSGTSLEVAVEFETGSGTHTDWTFSLIGEPGQNGLQGNDGFDGQDGLMPPGGRLTTTSGTPITSSDVTDSTTLYYTPYLHNHISLYNGATWDVITFSETQITIPNNSNTNYDVFAYNNGGTLAFETVNWTNSTTRATALVSQDGRLVKSGDATRLYMGTGRTSGTAQRQSDSAQRRRLFNMYNRVARTLRRQESATSWTYSSSAWQQVNNNTANEVEVVIGVVGPVVDLKHTYVGSMGDAAHTGFIGIGFDTVGNSGLASIVQGTSKEQMIASDIRIPAVGRHTWTPVERVLTTTIMTITSDNTSSELWGIFGTVEDM